MRRCSLSCTEMNFFPRNLVLFGLFTRFYVLLQDGSDGRCVKTPVAHVQPGAYFKTSDPNNLSSGTPGVFSVFGGSKVWGTHILTPYPHMGMGQNPGP